MSAAEGSGLERLAGVSEVEPKSPLRRESSRKNPKRSGLRTESVPYAIVIANREVH
ncbi:MAG TPA: hypothetical protein VGK22_06260 [Candidatus Angelobacter sp.]